MGSVSGGYTRGPGMDFIRKNPPQINQTKFTSIHPVGGPSNQQMQNVGGSDQILVNKTVYQGLLEDPMKKIKG